MQKKSIFLLLGFVLATCGFAYRLVRAESPLHEDAATGPESERTAGQTADQNSMQQIMQTMMSGVVPAGTKPGDLPDSSSEGAKLVAKYCAQCHDLPSPSMHAAHEWPGITERMFNRMTMCSRMSGTGMMGKMGGMGMGRMMGMMNIAAPSAKEQGVIVAYLKANSLKSIAPGVLPSPSSKGAMLFAATCTQCHALPDPRQLGAQEWPGVVARMQRNMASMGKTIPDAPTLRLITEFLQAASRTKP
jgi:mono/diheme cytochrome c family protein